MIYGFIDKAYQEKMLSEEYSVDLFLPAGMFCLELLHPGDTVLVAEVRCLARTALQLRLIADDLVKRKIGLIATRQGINMPPNSGSMNMATKVQISVFGLMAELAQDAIDGG